MASQEPNRNRDRSQEEEHGPPDPISTYERPTGVNKVTSRFTPAMTAGMIVGILIVLAVLAYLIWFT